MSFAASAPGLSNRKLYRNLFSTVPSDRALNQAAVKLLQRYKWTRVGVVTQEGPRLSEVNVGRSFSLKHALFLMPSRGRVYRENMKLLCT